MKYSGSNATIAISIALTYNVSIAQTLEQNNIIGHIANAKAAEVLCKSLTLNQEIVSLAYKIHHIKINDEPFKALYAKKVIEVVKNLRGLPERTICQTGKMLFGAGGTTFSDLLIQR